MLILDTNIISELMKAKPDSNVLAWADKQADQAVVITSIASAEIYTGLNALPNGKRKNALIEAFNFVLNEVITDILPFAHSEAEAYGVLVARLQQQGTPVGQSDTMIAAIALVHNATLVTRNTKHFINCGVDVVNPFLDGVL